MEKASSLTATGFLGVIGLRSFKSTGDVSDKVRQIKNLERAILSIATSQYLITATMKDRQRIQRWRYFDWLITTPMLLKTFHSLAEEKGYEESFIPVLIFDIIMIYAGYYAEFVAKSEKEKMIWYILGLISLAVIFYYVNRWDNHLKTQGIDTKQIPTFFYVGWSIYGANFLTPNSSLRQTGFSILDIFNKGIYSLHLESVLKTI